jgi:hypothetical protein
MRGELAIMPKKIAKVEYEYDEQSHVLRSVNIEGKELKYCIFSILNDSFKISSFNPLKRFSQEIKFSYQINEICGNLFDCIKILKQNTINEELVARLASYLFEGFSKYWVESLLLWKNDLTTGIQLWREILAVTNGWEIKNQNVKIHKGTPYFFLAESYLLTGERELGFLYLYTVIEEDKALARFAPSLNYPNKSPAYLTATMRRGNNQMDYLVEGWRNKLNEYIQKFNTLFYKSFKLDEFDAKFLDNLHLSNVVYFFVFNFIYFYEITSYAESALLQNEFQRLRTLDLIFNLCLIIDETLKESRSLVTGKQLSGSHTISNGISWLCDYKGWMKRTDVESFWKILNVKDGKPDIVIPKLLSMSGLYQGKHVRKEVFTLFVAHNLRNYGGHNISQQRIFTTNYDQIIEQLLMSLFLCLDI